MFVMNKTRFLYFLIILIILSVGVHFFHDLQLGHSDTYGITSGSCTGAIHYGYSRTEIHLVLLVVLLAMIDLTSWLLSRASQLSVFVPPPII